MRYLSLFSGIEAASAAWAPLGWECAAVAEIDPFACSVLKQRHPTVPNLGDITKVTEMQIAALGRLDLVVFGSPCFTAGHLVLCRRGFVKIEDVVVGDEVLTHLNRWKKVTAVMTRSAETVRMRGQGHNNMVATEDHPFYASETIRTGQVRSLGAPEWVHAKDMVGKRWATPVNVAPSGEVPVALRSADAAFLAGLYLGDGHIGRRQNRQSLSIILSVNSAKRDAILPRLSAAFGCITDLAHTPSVRRLQLSRDVYAQALLTHFGEHSHGKTIPAWALSASAEWREAFLEGVMATDGSVSPTGSLLVTTVSRAVAIGLRLLFAAGGYSTSLDFCKRPAQTTICGRTVNQRDTWQVCARNTARRSELRDETFAWGNVHSVTEAGVQQVYDITVADDHSFVCDGLVVHNCQDLSTAGQQKGFEGARSGLFFPAVDIIRWCRLWCGTRFALWENVPGAFSSSGGRDFAAVVDALSGLAGTPVPPKGWGTEGAALGPEAMVEWSTLDAQWFGVAQRRRRVFALADFGNWAGRSPILLEPQGMRGYSAPSRETGESVAGTLASRLGAGGFPGTDESLSGYGQPVLGTSLPVGHDDGQGGAEVRDDGGAPCLTCNHEAHIVAFNSNAQTDEMRFSPHVSASLTCSQNSAVALAHCGVMPTLRAGASNGSKGHGARSGDSKDEYIVPVVAIRTANTNANGHGLSVELTHTLDQAQGQAVAVGGSVAHTLRAEGADASEDGTGRGTPIVAYGFQPRIARNGRGDTGDIVGALTAQAGETGKGDAAPCVAYSTKLHNTASNNAGKLFAEYTTCLDANSPAPALLTPYQVRRLTPIECERLQGFPDNHTQIAYRNKPADKCPDGPRYKALGNSMAVPVMRWIGEQVEVALLFQE